MTGSLVAELREKASRRGRYVLPDDQGYANEVPSWESVLALIHIIDRVDEHLARIEGLLPWEASNRHASAAKHAQRARRIISSCSISKGVCDMPTGYTAEVGDGKVTEFSDFALTCARGFGALVLLRDSDQSLDATKRYVADGAYLDTSDYYPKALASALARLAELESLSDAEALAQAQQAADEVIASNADYNAKRAETQARYEDMLAKVEAWDPPTADHAKFKDFMADQLRESIKFDCGTFEMEVPEVSLAWRERELVGLRDQIARYETEIVKERERNEGRKAWVEALIDSLEGVPA